VEWKSRKLFSALVRDNEPGLTAFLRSCLADPAAVDDLVQESFIAAWVRGIAKNKILEHIRNHATDQAHVRLLTPELIDRIEDEHERLMSHSGTFLDRLRPLAECLDTLAADDRVIVERHYRDGQPCRFIAEQIGLGIEIIKKRLQRARSALRDCILTRLATEASDG